MNIRKHQLPNDILQTIGRYTVEWAGFESYFTLVLAVLLALPVAQESLPGQAERQMRHEFLRKFRLWQEIAPLYLGHDSQKKRLNSLHGRIGNDYSRRQWLIHGTLQSYTRGGYIRQILHSPQSPLSEETRIVSRQRIRHDLAHLQTTFAQFAAFCDGILWPQVHPLIQRYGEQAVARSTRRLLPKPEKHQTPPRSSQE